MEIRKLLLFVAVPVAILAAAALLLLQVAKTRKPHDGDWAQVSAIKSRESAAEATLDARNERIQGLLNTVKLAQPPGKGKQQPQEGEFHSEKHIAIILLGGLRAAEAVDALLDNLLYRAPPRTWTTRPIPTEEWYPATVALIRIGIPSVEPVLDNLEASESDEVTRLCTWILVEILGKDLAARKLQQRIAAAEGQLQGGQPVESIREQIEAFQSAVDEGKQSSDARATALETVRALEQKLTTRDSLTRAVGRLGAALEARYFAEDYNPYVLERRTVDLHSFYSDLREK